MSYLLLMNDAGPLLDDPFPMRALSHRCGGSRCNYIFDAQGWMRRRPILSSDDVIFHFVIKFQRFSCGAPREQAILRKSKPPRRSPEKWTFLSLAFYNAPSLDPVELMMIFDVALVHWPCLRSAEICAGQEEHSMDQCRSRLKLSENCERHWSTLISGEIHMDQSLGKFVCTNGPESSSKVSPYTGTGSWMALPSWSCAVEKGPQSNESYERENP